MKVISKECPNCKSNLEFRVGDKDIYCQSCRRKFAVEYDKDVTDPDVALKIKDIQLEMLDTAHSMIKRGRKVLPRIIIGYFIFAIVVVAILMVVFFINH